MLSAWVRFTVVAPRGLALLDPTLYLYEKARICMVDTGIARGGAGVTGGRRSLATPGGHEVRGRPGL